MNRKIVESARSMLSHSNMPNEWWAEAVINTAVYLRNRSPTTGGITPYESLFNKKPDVTNLRVFGISDVFRTFMFLTIREQSSMQSQRR